MNIRDSHFATAADLRSRGKFIATIDEMGNGNTDAGPLIPDLAVSLSTEFIFDIPVTDQIIISPIISVESDNVIGGRFSFDFDVDLNTFLDNGLLEGNNLMNLLQNATTFLEHVSSLQLELNAILGEEIPPALEGFFEIISTLQNFADTLLTYINLVNEGMYSYGLSLDSFSQPSHMLIFFY